MAAATAPIDTPQRSGDEVVVPVAAGVTIYPGVLVARDAAGNLNPASDTAGLKVVGRAEQPAWNQNGIAGAVWCKVARGCFRYANSGADPIDAGDIGALAYVADDQTIDATGGANHIVAGRIIGLDAEGVWVDTRFLS